MSEQPKPLTYENVLELIRETRESIRATREETRESIRNAEQERKEREAEWTRRMQATERQMKRTDRKISALGSRIGEIIEHMVSGRGSIVHKFRALNYDIIQWHRNTTFENNKLDISGEIDIFLEDGDTAILIEVKTTLETADVRKHMERLEKYRRYADAKGDKRRFIGAVAGAVVMEDAMQFAHENGLYVIVQSGKAVEIVPLPKDFRVKEW